jgi:Ni,Fe-hydrogenase I large subunit
MATRTLTLDPITRIEGHLRVDVEVDGGKVKKAWARGFSSQKFKKPACEPFRTF